MREINFNNIDFNKSTELCSIMNFNKSDKSNTHNYTLVYDFLFAELKNREIALMECGLGSTNENIRSNMGANGRPGASLYGWSEYFTNATIMGCDIDKDIHLKEFKTYFCDQTDPDTIQAMWSKIDINFDIIIDDGLHLFEANKCFFENSFHKLKSGGLYIIEDIYEGACPIFKKYFKEKGIKNNYVMRLPGRTAGDNCMAVIIKD